MYSYTKWRVFKKGRAFFKQEELSPKLILISYNHQVLTVS